VEARLRTEAARMGAAAMEAVASTAAVEATAAT
jgi:hypothetical protein